MINIKNVVFDMGGVLLKGKSIEILDDLNLDDSTYNELKKFFNNWYNLDVDNITIEEKFNMYDYDKNIQEKYKNILLEYYKYRKFNQDLINLIKTLKENNYNVYILSDNNKNALKYYKNHESFKNIDGWVFSCEYKTIKKEGKLFDIFLEKYHFKPNECYFIDNEIDNINEAKNHGINGYLFNEKEDINNLYKDMKEYGIKI